MTNEYIEVVLCAECVSVVEQLLQVVRNLTIVFLRYDTTLRCKLTVVRVEERSTTHLIEVHTCVEDELQVAVEAYLSETACRECVVVRSVLVELDILQLVRSTTGCALHTCVSTITDIVDREAPLVVDVLALSVADEDRVDRSSLQCSSKYVTTVACTLTAIALVRGHIGVSEVTTNLEPLLSLVVGTQTSGVTLLTRTLDDTVVVQVTERSEEVSLLTCCRYVYIVLLTE